MKNILLVRCWLCYKLTLLHVTCYMICYPQLWWRHSKRTLQLLQLHPTPQKQREEPWRPLYVVLLWCSAIIKTTIIGVFAAAMVSSSPTKVEVPQVDSTVQAFHEQLGRCCSSARQKINTRRCCWAEDGEDFFFMPLLHISEMWVKVASNYRL